MSPWEKLRMNPAGSGLLIVILLFLDGIIFGIAARKALASVILVVAGLLLAAFIGLGIPFFNASDFGNHLVRFLETQSSNFPGVIYAFPAAWIVGFIVGLLFARKLF